MRERVCELRARESDRVQERERESAKSTGGCLSSKRFCHKKLKKNVGGVMLKRVGGASNR